MPHLRAAAAALAGLAMIAGVAEAGGADCRRMPDREPCFSVRGELVVANGNPTFRLRPRGSRRVLGVVGGDGDAASPSALTPALRAAMTPPSPGEFRPVVGVFRACPLAPDRPGRMRPVCIADASRISLAPAPR